MKYPLENVPLDREPYPEAKDAVAWHEQEALEQTWELARLLNVTVEQVVAIFQESADLALAETPGFQLAVARPQMDTDDFRRYVAGKLGMM